VNARDVTGAEQATLELRPAPPYSFDFALAYLASSPSSVLETVDLDARGYERALRIDGVDLLFELRATGSIEVPVLECRVTGERLTPELLAQATARINQIFLLDIDPAPFFAVAQADPILWRLVESQPGIRPLLVADPYEALIFAIVGQQVNIAFARKMKLAWLERFGRRGVIGDREFVLVPEPERIAALDPADLLALQFSRQKASYTIGLSQAIVAGDLDLPALGRLPLDEAIAEMTRHKGIGRWTAEYVLMRGLGAPDSIPAGDLGLRKIIGRAYGLDHTASEAEVRAIAEAWTGWRGWAAFLWWLELQTNGLAPFIPTV
jgi:DNA-3-methyladenine glycosylase II